MSNSLGTVGAVAVGLVAAYAGVKLVRGKVYDFVIVKMTTEWYREVLDLLAPKSRVLDVGIGTGMALIHNKALVESKGIIVDGVDYDKDYIIDCKKNVTRHNMDSSVQVVHASVYDYTSEFKYDAVYFSGSLMIMPDPVKALSHTASLLSPDGRIYVTQTIQTKKSWATEVAKPFLKFVTTIDFGSVTYENQLLRAIADAGLKVLLNKAISGSSLDAVQSYRLIVLEKST
ncbi:hypothetical protein DYB37_011792 [Aphanomyces astaci]|uniref:Methyltransferase domain-containing protein n=1 Tax=Aphanomyces astaci TaxID=112090 RepID=A0A3R6WDR0_APHAT|nr:hypothetical protein DYB35_008622 [Aphanomyces astaci]RHZ30370.1 hypothetical protein DYB37_011792 [Aphanomyces astaci]